MPTPADCGNKFRQQRLMYWYWYYFHITACRKSGHSSNWKYAFIK